MLTLKFIQENRKTVIDSLKVKNFDATQLVDAILEKDELRKKTQQQQEECQAQMNTISKEIEMLFKDGKAQEANAAKEQSTQLKENIKVFTSRSYNFV